MVRTATCPLDGTVRDDLRQVGPPRLAVCLAEESFRRVLGILLRLAKWLFVTEQPLKRFHVLLGDIV